MVWTDHPLGTLPIIGTILWCRFPMGGNPNIPGGEHHPVLVLGRRIDIENRLGRLIVAYGTGTIKEDTRAHLDLIIPEAEYAAHGLMKPTRFDLADVNRLDLEWSDKWFTVPRSQPKIVIGKLSDASIERLKVILAWRKKNNRTD
jgi:hypothetical protein